MRVSASRPQGPHVLSAARSCISPTAFTDIVLTLAHAGARDICYCASEGPVHRVHDCDYCPQGSSLVALEVCTGGGTSGTVLVIGPPRETELARCPETPSSGDVSVAARNQQQACLWSTLFCMVAHFCWSQQPLRSRANSILQDQTTDINRQFVARSPNVCSG